MPIEHIHTYLIHPGKGANPRPEVGGTNVAKTGKLFGLLDEIYTNSLSQCDIDIAFNPSPSGAKQNECRDLLVGYVDKADISTGRSIGERLCAITDKRSGMGLLFLMQGSEGAKKRVVISRFPANSAILVEEGKGLSVEFLERVFVKNAGAYKAAVFEDSSTKAGFWLGKAVDRQVSSKDLQLSDYWIKDFLDAGFRATAAAGTRRLAGALREASRKATDVETKGKIAAAVTLAAGSMGGQLTSIDQFCDKFGLTGTAKAAIDAAVRNPTVLNEQFKFDATEFSQQVAYRSVELDTGGILVAPADEFDQVFTREPGAGEDVERFSTEGRVVNERLAKTK
jgi:hypothetical protein